MFSLRISAFAAVVAAIGVASAAHAGPAWEFTTAGNSFNNGTWDFATAFTVNSPVTVTGLGYYADPINGQADANPVALYSCDTVGCFTTGSLLASAIVTNIYPLFNHFRYVTIAPILLNPGDYEVAGVSFADNYTWADPGFATDPAITVVPFTTRWLAQSTPDFLNFINTAELESDGFWGPNIFLGQPTFAGVPEPMTLALFGAGLAGLGAMRRRRKARKSA